MVATASMVDSKQAIRDEVRMRLMAERSFLPFCQLVDRRYPAGARHIQLMTSKLEQVARYVLTGGKEGIGRLMIFMPPRYWKSQTAARKFPAWTLGKNPDLRIIMTSYGADLASKHSRGVRDLIESEDYQAVFGALASTDEPVIMDPESRSAAAWDIDGYIGGMIASGVGGGITGHGSNIFIIDDPVKNREEADSKKRREEAYEWYQSTAFTRLEKNAAIILIMTRWHGEDLGGKLLQAMIQDPDADEWEVLFLPAEALAEGSYPKNEDEFRNNLLTGLYIPRDGDQLGRKAGESLWPERHETEALKKIRANMGDYDYIAQFSQMPYSKAGQRYQRGWFKKVAKLPDPAARPPAPEGASPHSEEHPEKVGTSGIGGGFKLIFVVRYWDKANSAHGDYTAGVLMGYGSDGYFYFLDVTRKQCTSYERDRMMKKTAEADREKYGALVKLWHQQDPGSAGKDSAEATNRVLIGFAPKFATVTGDKETRSEPLESAFQGDMVRLLKGAWNEDFIEECVAFPSGAYDDQVDAGASAYSKLLQMIKKKRESRIL